MFRSKGPFLFARGLFPVVILGVCGVISAQPQTLNQNLVVNGGAEAGTAAQTPTDAQIKTIPGWTVTGSFSVGLYDRSGFLSASDLGPVARGAQLFYGGPSSQKSSAFQTIDLSGASAEIDSSRAKFYLSGYLGFLSGLTADVHSVSLSVQFLDATGAVLLQSGVNGPAEADLNIPEGLLPRATTGFVPPNTRKAKVTIDLASYSGAYNGYASDNVSLVLTTDPMFGVNLLVNGDAETDPQTENGEPVVGWNAHSNFAAWKWGDYKLPPLTSPGPPDRGHLFFTCAINQSTCNAFQTIDISNAKSLVDAGLLTYQLSGWLGGDSGTPDNASVGITFMNAAGGTVPNGTASIGPVTQADRNNQIAMLQRATSGPVPSGTRIIQVTLTFHRLRTDPENLAAYADSLYFRLDALQITTVVNAASSTPGPVAQNEFVTLYGSGMGPDAGAIGTAVTKGLGGSTVTFDGIEAYLIYASAGQINALVPYGVSTKADVVVQYNGRKSLPFPLQTTASAPGLFTKEYGTGPVWAVNNDGTFNSTATPVARGGWIAFWATGQGAVNPSGQDGETIVTPKALMLPVKVTIGGVDAQVLWTGLIYGGEMQANVTVPANAPTGDVPIILTVGTASSRVGVNISVK